MWNGVVWKDSAGFSLQGLHFNLKGGFCESPGTLRGKKRKETWKQGFSSSYSGKMPEVEWLSLVEKTQKGKKVV